MTLFWKGLIMDFCPVSNSSNSSYRKSQTKISTWAFLFLFRMRCKMMSASQKNKLFCLDLHSQDVFILELWILWCHIIPLFSSFFRALSETVKEQRRADSAFLEGDGRRVHNCKLLNQTSGMPFPPSHTHTHRVTIVFRKCFYVSYNLFITAFCAFLTS